MGFEPTTRCVEGIFLTRTTFMFMLLSVLLAIYRRCELNQLGTLQKLQHGRELTLDDLKTHHWAKIGKYVQSGRRERKQPPDRPLVNPTAAR